VAACGVGKAEYQLCQAAHLLTIAGIEGDHLPHISRHLWVHVVRVHVWCRLVAAADAAGVRGLVQLHRVLVLKEQERAANLGGTRSAFQDAQQRHCAFASGAAVVLELAGMINR